MMAHRATDNDVGLLRQLIFGVMLLLIIVCDYSSPSQASNLNDLWRGAAHFEQIGEIDWNKAPHGQTSEDSSWFTVRDGVWYAFSRVDPANPREHCSSTQMSVIVRQSRDHGKSWSDRVIVAQPGDSVKGDGCAILDGSSYFDPETGIWHMLAQCLDKDNLGGWAICHYSRKAASPMGRFVADPENPVVLGGGLWSRICTGMNGSCATSTVDEGTPDFVSKISGRFFVTFHGFDPASGHGVRGIASTTDFKHWQVKGGGLPDAPILGMADCAAWLSNCVGTGAASILQDSHYTYLLVETMDKSLICSVGQQWVFQLLRTAKGVWPVSGSRAWQRLADQPFLTPSAPDLATPCKLQYARWIVDGRHIFIVYEDWLPGRQHVHRRLLELKPGGGSTVRLR